VDRWVDRLRWGDRWVDRLRWGDRWVDRLRWSMVQGSSTLVKTTKPQKTAIFSKIAGPPRQWHTLTLFVTNNPMKN
jgi:hypothetical protein